MATGMSKTKWSGERHPLPQSSAESDFAVTLAYQGKKDVCEILSGETARVFKIWGVNAESGEMVNRLYWGDNLPILRGFLADERVRG